MTRIFDDPAQFTEDMTTGFAAANSRYVRQVPGGVVRAGSSAQGKVAVITGGGSGHYPAFCGVVGPGFADGSVIGNVFTSPSAEQAYSVAVEAENGGGVLFAFGNYAGDNLNFGLAVQRLEAEGIPAANIVITDDIASAPAEENEKRRGIAGGFTVFKIAGAAAEAGYDFAEVRRVAEHCNDRTRSLGIAYDGCTLPGQDHPLFTVPEGKMGVGLGIHGEPGVSEQDMESASELAARLVNGVLAEAPSDGKRVAVLLNGLGRSKYEELFVLWGKMVPLFADAGLELVEPEVGELVTSLDMAGLSLTVTWLDDELEKFWSAAADSPAYRKGAAVTERPGAAYTHSREHRNAETAESTPANEDGLRCTRTIIAAVSTASAAIVGAEEELGRLDSVAGDGDHGRGMHKGIVSAVQALRDNENSAPATALAAAGDAWAADAGGTSGVLWGAALRAFGSALPPDRAASGKDISTAAEKALETLTTLGKAELGDKTMLDAIAPFVSALREHEGEDLAPAWRAAAAAATDAAQATAQLRPKIGRARPLAERSIGTPDPGAISFALIVTAIAEVLEP